MRTQWFVWCHDNNDEACQLDVEDNDDDEHDDDVWKQSDTGNCK